MQKGLEPAFLRSSLIGCTQVVLLWHDEIIARAGASLGFFACHASGAALLVFAASFDKPELIHP